MKAEERIWILIAPKLAGEASDKDLDELHQLLKENPDISYSVQLMMDLWNSSVPASVPAGSNSEKHFQRTMQSRNLNVRSQNHFLNKNFMIKNYFKIAWRNISKHKIYTTINVLGLALGICACIVIYLITDYELSFDKFHPDKERIYRIVGEVQHDNGEKMFLNSPVPEVAGFETQIPGFEAKAGFHLYGASIKIPGEKNQLKTFDNNIKYSYSSTAIITWPQYFDVFKYEWLAGNATSLNEPFKVVLSENRAKMYFGNIPLDKMIGKTVIYDDSVKTSVSGIVRDWDKNTDFGFTDFISVSTAPKSILKNQIPTDNWSSLSPHRAMAFVQLQPLTSIHFTTEFHRGDDGDDFRKPYLPTLYALVGLALFILLIAIVNFVNLSTAQSLQRAKEVGIRKVMGSNKANITLQFLIETLSVTLFAIFVSVILVKPILTAFSDFIPPGVSFHIFNFSSLGFLIVVTLITSLLAGLYPARVLASYLPSLSLKGISVQGTGGKGNLRKGLIIFQFSISLIFIIGAIVIGNQIRFMRNTDKGFNSDAIVVINHWRDHGGQIKVFAENIKHIAGIDKVIVQGTSPMGFAHGGENFKFRGKDEINLQVSFDAANEDFVPFYQMKIIAGRNMGHSDSLHELVINETCSKAMGFENPADAVGKFLYQNDKPYPVAGVVADFHEGSFHEGMKPVVIAKMPQRESSVAIELAATGDAKAIITSLEKEWGKIYPEDGFNYSFMNDAIARLYDQETKTAWLVNVAMGITIFISCMGLFGLAMFTAEKRTKEIGIRKVLGASVANVVTMLSKDFVVLVLLAAVIASPVAWYFMNQWLQDFAYRIDIRWWVFVLAGTGAILIALMTVSFQAIKAAIANPVKSLRTE
jgi:putative ABC transport system permease protein